MKSISVGKNRGAFTLIELLVVIAIVGILSGLIVISMSGTTDSAKVAKSKTNIDAIRKALIYYGTLHGNTYPIQATQCDIAPVGVSGRCANLDVLSDMLPVFPTDPNGAYYEYISDGSTFTVSAAFSSSTLSYFSGSGYAVGPVDIDGNAYGAVVIGNQTWMSSNLMTTRYADGTAIARGPAGGGWDGADHGYYAYPPAVGNAAEETLANIQANKLGLVYQWSAAMHGSVTPGAQGVCPNGWHVPTDAEWCTLEQTLDSSIACSTTGWRGVDGGGRLKESGTTHWTTPNTGANNSSGFTALGSGYRGIDGSCFNRSADTHLWSGSESGASAWSRTLNYAEPRINRSTSSKAYGFFVRCVKN